MKQRLILFSTPMVKAERAGLKTQTRRIIKSRTGHFNIHKTSDGIPYQVVEVDEDGFKTGKEIKCPYGAPGDQLYIREKWTWEGDTSWKDIDPIGFFFYKADFEEGEGPVKWKPSIHMPKIAARTILEIDEVCIERLQDISEEDARAEGIERWTEERMRSRPTHYKLYYHEPGDDSSYSSCPIVSFQTLWQSINGPESWESNPWVWKISFRRVEN